MEKSILSNAPQLNFVRSLSSKDRDELCKNSTLITIQKGETIFSEDEKLQNLFCIQEGICKFSRLDDTGKEQIVKLLGAGELMGRRSVITDAGAAVSAKAITKTIICKVDKKPFLKNLMKNSAFCMDVLKGFLADVKKEERALDFLSNQKSIPARLAALLCYLHHYFGVEEDETLTAKLRREDMANIIGTSSEYVVTLLQNFKKKGLIETKKRCILIRSEEGLRKLING